MDIIVGIDLGTTNSEVADLRDGQPHVCPDAEGDPILPSFVGLAEDGRLLVGKAAHNQWVLAPERTVKSIKRRMGQDVKVRLGEQEYRPQEISAMILKELRDRASRELGVDVRKAVITVPAYFNDSQRQATREAGELAGLEVVRILNEPTAASLTYDPSQSELRRMLVYDLGGGTFDCSIVQAQEGVVEVLSSHGDTQLGGDDFDDLLLKHVCDRFEAEHGVDLRANLVSKARVLRAIQAGIIAGMDVGSVLVDITPHTLGIRCLDTMHGFDFPFRFAPIIHRNTPLPASRGEVFHTVYDRQSEVEVDVFQGESEDVRN